MQILRLVSVLLISLFLFACATTQNYALAVNSWRGANINQVVQIWGYPSKTGRAPNGNKLYIYHSRSRGRNPIYSTGGGTTVITEGNKTSVATMPTTISGGGSYDLQCTTWFEVNKHGTIVNTSFRGNNCQATTDFLKSHVYTRGN